eukprot:53363-Eustigmatos_ZCMA.PRE.1
MLKGRVLIKPHLFYVTHEGLQARIALKCRRDRLASYLFGVRACHLGRVGLGEVRQVIRDVVRSVRYRAEEGLRSHRG